MKTPDEDDKDFDRDAYKRGLEGDEDIIFPSEENQEGLKKHDEIEAELDAKEQRKEEKDDD